MVSCPDHMHASAAMWAMARGKHVYCQKPLTRTVWEAQQLTLAAAKYGVATQMGNQGYSSEGARQCCEIVWSGEIGDVTEVHAWTDRPANTGRKARMWCPRKRPCPPLWTGRCGWATPSRGLTAPRTCRCNWRAFPDFGCGAIGDMACHILGTPNMAMRLANPTSVECVDAGGQEQVHLPAESVNPFRFPGARRDAAAQALLARRHEEAAGHPRRSGRRTAGRQGHQRQPVHRRAKAWSPPAATASTRAWSRRRR